jgi:hypothetical protein
MNRSGTGMIRFRVSNDLCALLHTSLFTQKLARLSTQMCIDQTYVLSRMTGRHAAYFLLRWR